MTVALLRDLSAEVIFLPRSAKTMMARFRCSYSTTYQAQQIDKRSH